ncbi:MAG: hypothetical protein AB1644_12430 [Candidatus Zixiibacteriota bacterium]
MRDRNQTTQYVVQVILHPLFMLSLLALIINDHLLKAHHPSWLTGKLSDFAGLCVFVALLFAILRRRITTSRRLVILHVVVGMLFVIWKLSPIEGLLATVSSLISPYVVGRTRDAGDLVALLVLPLCHLVLRGAIVDMGTPERTEVHWRIASVLWLTAASFAVVATSILPPYTVRQEHPLPRGARTDAEVLFRAEQTLAHQGVQVLRRTTMEEGVFEYLVGCDTVIVCGPGSSKAKPRQFRLKGTLKLSLSDPQVLRVVAEIWTYDKIRYEESWKKPIVDSVVAIRIVRPVLEELAK